MKLDRLAWEVLNAIADDWESVEQIVPTVNDFVDPVDGGALAVVLVHLIDMGLVRVARTTEEGHMTDMDSGFTVGPAAIIEDPPDYWFAMTPRGRAIWQSDRPKSLGEPSM